MSQLYIKKQDDKGIVTISLNRPEIHNAFNDELIESLTKEFLNLSRDKSVQVIVLTGEGKSFCAGADLNWMKKMVDYSEDENYQDSMALATLFETINSCPKVVVGKVNGAALGGGTGLVAVCDHVIVHEDAILGLTETRLGLVPAVISPYVIKKIGESHARTLFLSGKRFDAKEALRLGLVHQVSLDRHFENDTQKVCLEFLKSAPEAKGVAKQLIRDVVQMSDASEYMDYTCKTIAKRRISSEGQEGMSALLEKRRPNWINKD